MTSTSKTKKVEVACFYCNQKLYRWPSQIKGLVTCGKSCPKAKEIRVCSRCGDKFEAYLSEKRKTCSKKCPGVREYRVCERCGNRFRWLRESGSGRFCTDICRLDWFSTHFVQELSPSWRGGLADNAKCSPARRSAYKKGDPIDRLLIFERDDWFCHICKTEIDRDKRFPDDMAATLDHIIPLSKGGTHTWDNVASAHARCNYIKGNSLD